LFGELNNKNKQKNFAEEIIEKLLTRKSSIKIGFFSFLKLKFPSTLIDTIDNNNIILPKKPKGLTKKIQG
jgi:hypothetical protein